LIEFERRKRTIAGIELLKTEKNAEIESSKRERRCVVLSCLFGKLERRIAFNMC